MFDLFKRDNATPSRPWGERLKEGLARSRDKWGGALASALRRPALDDETLETIEAALLSADVGVAATQALIDDLRARWKHAGGHGEPRKILKAALLDLLEPLQCSLLVSAAR